jgi:glycosyltransferase involved in cell wall biosynthesis
VIVAGEEDFGLATAEAQASGRPPVAFAAGGSLEIVGHGTTGFLFGEHTPESLHEALMQARDQALDVADLVASARRFAPARFLEAFEAALATAVEPQLSRGATAAVSA